MMGNWVRVSQRRRCPVCGGDHWCLIAKDGTAVICPRTPSDRRAGEAGYLHRLADSPMRVPSPRRITLGPKQVSRGNLTALSRRLQIAADRTGKLDVLAEVLGLSRLSMVRYGVGWHERQRCWTWPMFDGRGQIVGLTRRFGDGSKKTMAHHRAGLFMPADLPANMDGLTLLIAEGATDAVAAADMGLWAVGRFSCSHGARMLARMVSGRGPDLVAICADRGNEHELKGAETLATALLPHVARLKVIAPPAPHKDLRAWRGAGVEAAELRALVEVAPRRRLMIKVQT